MLAIDEAERRGDALAALDLMEEHLGFDDGSLFWKHERMERLLQVVIFGPALPRWAISRWIVEQARQHLHPQIDVRRRRATQLAMELRVTARLPQFEHAAAMARVLDRDWVYRQLTLYEYGGLDLFLRCGASPDLVSAADGIRGWPQAPMRCLRFEGSRPDKLTWRDLGSGELVRVLNLGAAVLLGRGQCALGRLVPVESGLMFDGPPLRVSDEAAALAAEDPAGWLEAVRHDAGSEIFQPSLVRGNMLLTDVSDTVVKVVLEPYLSRAAAEVTIEDVADAVLRLAREALSAQPRQLDALAAWPCLAAELVAPCVMVALGERAQQHDAPALEALADLLPEPAAEVCRELLRGLDAAA